MCLFLALSSPGLRCGKFCTAVIHKSQLVLESEPVSTRTLDGQLSSDVFSIVGSFLDPISSAVMSFVPLPYYRTNPVPVPILPPTLVAQPPTSSPNPARRPIYSRFRPVPVPVPVPFYSYYYPYVPRFPAFNFPAHQIVTPKPTVSTTSSVSNKDCGEYRKAHLDEFKNCSLLECVCRKLGTKGHQRSTRQGEPIPMDGFRSDITRQQQPRDVWRISDQ